MTDHSFSLFCTHARTVSEPPGDPPPDCVGQLRVLGKFELTIGSRRQTLGTSCQAMLTLLAMKNGQVNRIHAAGLLWPDATSSRANANLRSLLWRLQRCCCDSLDDVMTASFYELRLSPRLSVDLHAVTTIAHRLLERSAPMSTEELREALRHNLYEDIDPDLGDDEWLTVERERHRQLRLHALESLCHQLIRVGWHGSAVEAALSVVNADPYRETARQLLIKAYLAEGNHVDARRQYAEYRALLQSELGIEPSQPLMRLLPPSAEATTTPPAPVRYGQSPRLMARSAGQLR